MWRQFKEAFLAPVRMPLLGDFPLNAGAFAGLIVLGFGHPGFWFLAIGLETAYLWALLSSARFRNWVNAKSRVEDLANQEQTTASYIQALDAGNRAEHAELEDACRQVLETYRQNRTDDLIATTNVEALGKMATLHARLLLARQQIDRRDAEDDEEGLVRDTTNLERELADSKLPDGLRRSKSATLEIMRKRLRSLEARRQGRAEIESDLQRIRSHVQLALDNAAMQSKPAAINLDLELSSQLIDWSDGNWSTPEPPIRQ